MNQQLQTAAQVSTQTWQVLCKAKVQTQHGHRNADTAWTQECRHNNMDTGMQTQHAWWWIVCMQASRCNAMCGVASSVCVCGVVYVVPSKGVSGSPCANNEASKKGVVVICAVDSGAACASCLALVPAGSSVVTASATSWISVLKAVTNWSPRPMLLQTR
mgnify:CR=1 FL=1